MSVVNAKELSEHIGHDIEVAKYEKDGIVYEVCVECVTCYEVLYSEEVK